MALYIGTKQVNLNSGDKKYIMNSHVVTSKLKSSDEYTLKDKDNLYLTSKEGGK